MSMKTNLQGRLRNTSLPYSSGLLPLFDAVANSIQSIEEAGLPMGQGRISIEILRDTQSKMDFPGDAKKPGPEPKGDIVGFKITDNGIGFNDENYNSFLELDSEHKADQGGRGVGRLLWLKAFQRANISSVFEDENGNFQQRIFSFNASSGVSDVKKEKVQDSERKTSVQLDDFLKRYREPSAKTATGIANDLIEHCLWYFVRDGGAPKIIIEDDGDYIDLDQVYDEHMISAATTETISIKDVEFELIHIKLRASSARTHRIAFCATNRLVKEESIKGKIPGLFGSLSDESGDFVYECYISSAFLDETVRSERTGFDINEEPMELFAETEISQQDIREGVITKAAEHLSEYLDQNLKNGQERVEKFIQKAPRYRSIVARMPEDQLNIDPDTSDKELDVYLHKQFLEVESKLLEDGHDVMSPKDNENYADYYKRLREYLQTVEDLKKSDLANYVSHRKVILDLLDIAIQKNEDGEYEREDLIHNLIMPMRTDSNEVMFDSCNLWLIDERLAFHDYLASDKTLSSMPITNSSETKAPDILALNVFDEPILVSEGEKLPLASIVVVELKRPMRDDAAAGEDKDPIEQALGYLERIREGKVKTSSGRPIPDSEDIPGFCYIICDLTPSIVKRCRFLGATRTSDGMGYFFHNPNLKCICRSYFL